MFIGTLKKLLSAVTSLALLTNFHSLSLFLCSFRLSSLFQRSAATTLLSSNGYTVVLVRIFVVPTVGRNIILNLMELMDQLLDYWIKSIRCDSLLSLRNLDRENVHLQFLNSYSIRDGEATLISVEFQRSIPGLAFPQSLAMHRMHQWPVSVGCLSPFLPRAHSHSLSVRDHNSATHFPHADTIRNALECSLPLPNVSPFKTIMAYTFPSAFATNSFRFLYSLRRHGRPPALAAMQPICTQNANVALSLRVVCKWPGRSSPHSPECCNQIVKAQ